MILICLQGLQTHALGLGFLDSLDTFEQSIEGSLLNTVRADIVTMFPMDVQLSPPLDYYQRPDARCLWVNAYGPTYQAMQVIQALKQAPQHGIAIEQLHLKELQDLVQRRRYTTLARLEILLTQAAARYMDILVNGNIAPQDEDPRLNRLQTPLPEDTSRLLPYLCEANNPETFFQHLAPNQLEYRLLQKTLASYQRIAAQGGWPRIPHGPVLHPGEYDKRLPLIAKRLLATGELQKGQGSSRVYSTPLVEAVKKFQQRFFLQPDGILGKATLDAMNLSVEETILKIRINMERWRWLPSRFSTRYVLVNIPAYRLYAIDSSARSGIQDMPVVVGSPSSPTPAFSDTIRYIELNPFWKVTPTIAKENILPMQQKDPYYLHNNHFRIFDSWQDGAQELDPLSLNWSTLERKIGALQIRQDPGPWNTLGSAKFMFPNPLNIYLHHTSEPQLFRSQQRALSHGCIRLPDPAGMAAWLLGDTSQARSKRQIERIIKSGRRMVIHLPKTIPVHLTYITVAVAPGTTTLYVRPDIYKRDQQLSSLLFAGYEEGDQNQFK